jgi:O-antigen/teichoic acid export membrane protein
LTGNLTNGRLLARNTLINVISRVVPLLVALFAIPALIGRIGVDRYGVLTLSMMVVGYFSLFDFGLGRAATKYIAEAAAAGDRDKIPSLFWTSLYLMLVFGALAGVVVAVLTPWLVHVILRIPPSLRTESIPAFYILAISMPFVISAGSLTGTLSAIQRFDLINAIGVPTVIMSYLGPLAILFFSKDLGWIVAMLVVGRIAGWIASLILCLRKVPSICDDIRPVRGIIRPLLSFGGWITISGLSLPIMSYFDRFLIGAMLSMAAVSYYAVPCQVTEKFSLIPGALGAVIFAAFSATSTSNPARAAILFERANRYVILALFPATLILVTLAPEALSLWLGRSFAAESTTAMRWLAVGAFINCLSWTPGALIQAAERPDITAIVHVAEAPFYVFILWWMLAWYGVAGAAFALALRSTVDTALFLMISSRIAPMTTRGVLRVAGIAFSALPIFAFAVLPEELATKCLFLAVALGLFGLLAWRVFLDPSERELICGYAGLDGMKALLAKQ